MTLKTMIAGGLLCLLALGCNQHGSDMPELGIVSGIVTWNGKPMTGVSVYFKPAVGRPSIGKADEQGRYTAMYLMDTEGVKIGTNKVWLEWGIDETGPPIPPKFGQQSTMTLEVKAGANQFDIQVASGDK